MNNYIVNFIPDLITRKNESYSLQKWFVKAKDELEALSIVAKKQVHFKEDWLEDYSLGYEKVQFNLFRRKIFFVVEDFKPFLVEKLEKTIAEVYILNK